MILTKENTVDELIRFRMRNQLTQDQVEKKTGIKAPHLSKLENGESKPQKKTLITLNDFIKAFEGRK